MKLSEIILTIFLMSGIWACKAQVTTVSNTTEKPNYNSTYVEKINSLLNGAKCDTVDVWSPPKFSTITSVIAYSLEGKSIEISYNSGTRIGFVPIERFYLDAVGYNKKGEVISGLQDVVLSGSKMVVYVKHCDSCKFSKTKGDL